MAKLTDESPRLFRPTLAAWIGLNESIFLEQLHFIITEMEGRGKFADGQKWYRDTPRAFVVTYFPFWDESIVKRTIANLRADALILARSDLNDDPKDRSLWYTINYPALERLDGPVERITGKSAKRKEARKARKAGADSQPEYTKVQNVLIKNKGTNSTLESQQNVLLPQVQNVPTPKESSILKDSEPKDSSPYGEGGKPPPPIQEIEPELEQTAEEIENPAKHPAIQAYRSVANRYPDKATWDMIATAVGRDPPDIAFWTNVVRDYIACGWNKINVKTMLEHYKRRELPTQKASKNGYHGTSQNNPGNDPALESGGLTGTAREIAEAFDRKRRRGRDPT